MTGIEVKIKYDGSGLGVWPRWQAWYGMSMVAQAYTRRGIERRARRYQRRMSKRFDYVLEGDGRKVD